MKQNRKAMKHILVIHGPNLHLLGSREPGIYGTVTLASINAALKKTAKKKNVRLHIISPISKAIL